MGFFSKSSPPGGRLNQGAEVRDLENQLRAPKPRPTATSWKNKPMIVIPATLVCLILSCFILYACSPYLMPAPEHLTIQTGDAGLQSEPSQAGTVSPEPETPHLITAIPPPSHDIIPTDLQPAKPDVRTVDGAGVSHTIQKPPIPSSIKPSTPIQAGQASMSPELSQAETPTRPLAPVSHPSSQGTISTDLQPTESDIAPSSIKPSTTPIQTGGDSMPSEPSQVGTVVTPEPQTSPLVIAIPPPPVISIDGTSTSPTIQTPLTSISDQPPNPHAIYFEQRLNGPWELKEGVFYFRIFGLTRGNKVSIPPYGSGEADENGIATILDKDASFRHVFGVTVNNPDPETIEVAVDGETKLLTLLSPKIDDYTTKTTTSIKLKGLMPGFFALLTCRDEKCPSADKWEKMRIDNRKHQWYIQKVDADGEVTFTTGFVSSLDGGQSVYLYYGIEGDLKRIGEFVLGTGSEKVILHASEFQTTPERHQTDPFPDLSSDQA
eukprot:202826_1